MDSIVRDISHACRALVRMPVLAAVVILSLAIGIGVNTVVFSWIQAIVFKPIPGVADAANIYVVESRADSGVRPGTSWAEYRDLKEQIRAVPDLSAFRMVPLNIGETSRSERTYGLLISGNYFSSLGLQPIAGRFVREEEVTRPGADPVVVISYDYWQTRLGAAPVIGERIRINGADLTIVGIAPRGFNGTVMRLVFDVWLPATLGPLLLNGARDLEDRGVRAYTIAGRLAAGARRAQAQDEVAGAMRQLEQAYPRTNRGLQAEVLPFWSSPRGPQRAMAASLVVLQAIMLLLLLAVCGNAANLVLARASARQREMSVRLALGAPRWRIARLVLVETVLLAAAGGAAGCAVAFWGTALLNAMPPLRVRGIPVSFATSVDPGTLLFAVVLALACGGLFGLAPAMQLAGAAPHTLRAGGATPPRRRLRNALMAVEVALAVVVLVAAGMFLRDFLSTRTDDPGFRREGVLLAGYDLAGRGVSDAALRAFAASLLERLRATPGIQGAAIASSVPLDIHGLPTRSFSLEGRARPDGALDEALANVVTPGYFAVMRLPLLAGRDFADLRDTAAPPQAIVNEAFVRRFLDGRSPLGLGIDARGRRYVITGVVKTSLYNAFGEPPTPIVYFSFRDRPIATGEIHLLAPPGREAASANAVRVIVHDLEPELPLYDVRTLSDHIEANLIFRRIPARMFAVLAPLLLLIAAIGIYAVVAYAVSLRTMEIGVRMALGASGARVVAHFVGEHLLVVLGGTVAGWLAAFFAVVGVFGAPFDPAVFAGVPIALIAVALAAAWWPARRASLVDPLHALRSE